MGSIPAPEARRVGPWSGWSEVSEPGAVGGDDAVAGIDCPDEGTMFEQAGEAGVPVGFA